MWHKVKASGPHSQHQIYNKGFLFDCFFFLNYWITLIGNVRIGCCCWWSSIVVHNNPIRLDHFLYDSQTRHKINTLRLKGLDRTSHVKVNLLVL